MISMEEKIAIVIPAYKCRFLRQTLDSIVVQTCRSFSFCWINWKEEFIRLLVNMFLLVIYMNG